MINLRIRVTGLQEFINATNRAIAALDEGVFIEEIAKKCKRRAKYRGPRDTGKLVASIDYKLKKDGFVLTCEAINDYGVEYSEILEFGLSKYIPIGSPEHPRVYKSASGKTAHLPFMQWAIWRTLQDIDKIMKETVLKYYH